MLLTWFLGKKRIRKSPRGDRSSETCSDICWCQVRVPLERLFRDGSKIFYILYIERTTWGRGRSTSFKYLLLLILFLLLRAPLSHDYAFLIHLSSTRFVSSHEGCSLYYYLHEMKWNFGSRSRSRDGNDGAEKSTKRPRDALHFFFTPSWSTLTCTLSFLPHTFFIIIIIIIKIDRFWAALYKTFQTPERNLIGGLLCMCVPVTRVWSKKKKRIAWSLDLDEHMCSKE